MIYMHFKIVQTLYYYIDSYNYFDNLWRNTWSYNHDSYSITWGLSIGEHMQVDLPIHFSNGDMAVVTFTGEGYDTTTLADGVTLPNSQDTKV